MATETKRQKIEKAIALLEQMTRAQWLTGAITGSNTTIITAIQLLQHAKEVQEKRKPRIKKTKIIPEKEWKFPNPDKEKSIDTKTKPLNLES